VPNFQKKFKFKLPNLYNRLQQKDQNILILEIFYFQIQSIAEFGQNILVRNSQFGYIAKLKKIKIKTLHAPHSGKKIKIKILQNKYFSNKWIIHVSVIMSFLLMKFCQILA